MASALNSIRAYEPLCGDKASRVEVIMTEEHKEKSDLQKALDLDAEIESWEIQVNGKIISLHDQIDEAEESNDQKLVEKLNEKLDAWISVSQAGYSFAEQTEQGREILDFVREQKKESEARLVTYRKKQKEPNNNGQ